MSEDQQLWQDHNELYLHEALSWLRLRLRQMAPNSAPLVQPTPPAAQPPHTNQLFPFLNQAVVQTTTTEPDQDRLFTSNDEPLARANMDQAAASDPPPALILLAQHFGLSTFEQEVLLLCAAMELDAHMPKLIAQAQDDAQKPHPTFALAMMLFDDPRWDVLSPKRPLRFWQLIEINQPGATPLTTSPLCIDERILNYIKGLNYLDDRMMPFLAPFDLHHTQQALPSSQETAVGLAARHWQTTNGGPFPTIQLLGIDSLSKQLVAQRLANLLNISLYRLPAEVLPTEMSQLESLARIWQRESVLLPIGLFIDAQDIDDTTQSGQFSPVNRFLAQSQGLFLLSTREVRADGGATAVAVEVNKPTPLEQRQLWEAILRNELPESPAKLAVQFNLNAVTIQQITHFANSEAQAAQEEVTHKRLWNACLINTRPRLDMLAQRIEPKATWDHIILPDPLRTLLEQMVAQVHHRNIVYDQWGFRARLSRGLGINALFAGESGTGKTMAAEVIANALQLNLYRIDLSAVVSKYIGETEKNLRRLFDAAEDGGVILFFDEADSLFGKRSEVKDSHDRYANIQVNYLLQRMEAFVGLAILATNLKGAIDHAFKRRLRFIVNFPFPTPQQRQAIWERIFPKETDLSKAGLDFAHLSRLNLTGGSIQNVALNAAFLAAQANGAVSMPLILEAARQEFRKLERPVREADLRWETSLPKLTAQVPTE
ncbi:MAG: ATP-binding protein [Chloroflexi bacterium]|nr:MAG: ATP-binding protein [Chloroflexota bacterium]